jgi:hypothetical protein
LRSFKNTAIEIAACEPLAGRLASQAKTRVRAGGRPAAMSAGDDFNRRISSVVAGGYAHEQLLQKYPRLKSLRASRWLVAWLRRRRRASAQADARQQCPPETISIVEFSSVVAGGYAHEQLLQKYRD